MTTSNIDEQFFRSLQWCNQLLNEQQWTTFAPNSAVDVDDTKGIYRPGSEYNRFFWHTLNSRDTMRHILVQHTTPKQPSDFPVLRVFVSLGSDLDGWKGLCHGGAAATILDEACAGVVYVCTTMRGISDPVVTADLRIKFLHSITTPSVAVIEARIERQEGRNFFVGAEMIDQQGLLSTASAQVVVIKPKQPKL